MFIIHSFNKENAIISDKIEMITIDRDEDDERLSCLKINGVEIINLYKEWDLGISDLYALKDDIVELLRIDRERNDNNCTREYYITKDCKLTKIDNEKEICGRSFKICL